MRIGIDMISGGSGLKVGVGAMRAYYRGMVGAMATMEHPHDLVTFTTPRFPPVELPYGDRLHEVRCHGVPADKFGRVLYEHAVLGPLAHYHSIDVLLSTCNVRPALWRGASVVVVQALPNYLFWDRARARGNYRKAVMPPSLRRADRVIAVSDAARQDAIRLFGLEPERVVTVYHGCAEWAVEAAASHQRAGPPPIPPPLTPGPYILNVSSLYSLKNHSRLIEGFGMMVKRTAHPHDLVIAGGDSDVTRTELREVATRSRVGSRVQLLGRCPPEHIAALYANADGIAYPSLYETFGLPVLEAFAFERVLLTSNTGGAAEIAADAAITIDPQSVESIADGLQQLVEDRELRKRLVSAGTRRLQDFSWARCGGETLAVVEAAATAHA